MHGLAPTERARPELRQQQQVQAGQRPDQRQVLRAAELPRQQHLEQQQRDLEGVSIRDAIVGRAMSTDLPLDLSPAESEADDELDLTTLPTLEEYRSDGKA